MQIESIPFDGLYIVYKRINGQITRLFHGFTSADIPAEYAGAVVIRIYPADNSIIVEI